MNLRTMIIGILAAFSTSACTHVPAEKRSGEMTTDPNGCTTWKAAGEDSSKPRPCIITEKPSPLK